MGDVLLGMQPYGRFLAGMGRNISKGGKSRQLLARRGELKLTKKQAEDLALKEGEYVEDTSAADAAEKKRLEAEDRELRRRVTESQLERSVPFHEQAPEDQTKILEGIKKQTEARLIPRVQKPTESELKRQRTAEFVGGPQEVPPPVQPNIEQQFPGMTQPVAPGAGPAIEAPPAKRPPGLEDATDEQMALISANIGYSVEDARREIRAEKRLKALAAKKEQSATDKAEIEKLEAEKEVRDEVSAIRAVDPSITQPEAARLQKIGVTAKDLFMEKRREEKERQKTAEKQRLELVEIEATDAANKMVELLTDQTTPMEVKFNASTALQQKADAGDDRAIAAIKKIQQMTAKGQKTMGGVTRQSEGEVRRQQLREL